jgi:L-ascorbate metabolism protein UlaG (beta-lactamase superfamily)
MYVVTTALCLMLCLMGLAHAQEPIESDRIATSAGDLSINFLGHATLVFAFDGKTVHVDPCRKVCPSYDKFAKADLILVTHEHPDHFDPEAIRALRTTNTMVLLTAACAKDVAGGTVMRNGDVRTEKGLKIECVPAYNLVHKRPDGQPFHPKGAGNGYIVTFGDKRVYVGGDTENTPEMKSLAGIDVAFLPMNLPYTMTPEMVVDAVKAFKPRILYPYHYGETDVARLTTGLKDAAEIEVRVRKMK